VRENPAVSENARVIARAIAALNARDAEGARELFDEEIEWRPAITAGGAVEGAVYRGVAGMLEYLEEVDAEFADMSFGIDGIDDLGSGQVLYRGRVSARGKSSGVPLDVAVWGLWQVRNGKLLKGAGYLSEAEARRAARERASGALARDPD
jgi:ketosteroid isomerase-like protein